MSQLSNRDRALIEIIRGNLNRIIEGRPVDLVEVPRKDELGVVANLVKRVARELSRSRRRDRHARTEIDRRMKDIEEAHAQQERLLETILELSSPVLNVYDGVLLLPLIGAVDATRAEHMTRKLLERITKTGSPVVILDITGVPSLDGEVADLLLRAARAARLLGARTILSGVSPAVAKVAVELGVDLSSLTPSGDLKAALALAISLAQPRT
jgi:rsbT co-antagonist protein RsbR